MGVLRRNGGFVRSLYVDVFAFRAGCGMMDGG